MARETPQSWRSGWVELPDSATKVDFRPAVDGVVWPIEMELNYPPSPVRPGGQSDSEILLAVELRVELRFDAPSLGMLPIAESHLTNHRLFRPGGTSIWFDVPVSSGALARIEALRNGTAPRFDVCVRGGVVRTGSYVMAGEDARPADATASIPFSVPLETWISALRRVGVSQNVLVEIPITSLARPEFEVVRKAFAEAVAEFERGGQAAWRGCVAAIRHALDSWPGFQAQQTLLTFKREWTVEQRFTALREAVRNATHPAHHGLAEEWDRSSALALLAATATLLAREGA